MANYGDPRSQSTTPSNGPGNEGGMGTAAGTVSVKGRARVLVPDEDGNIGGDRKGRGCCGPGGSDGHNPGRSGSRLSGAASERARARDSQKPEPQYTEEARRNAITGSVVLRVCFRVRAK